MERESVLAKRLYGDLEENMRLSCVCYVSPDMTVHTGPTPDDREYVYPISRWYLDGAPKTQVLCEIITYIHVIRRGFGQQL